MTQEQTIQKRKKITHELIVAKNEIIFQLTQHIKWIEIKWSWKVNWCPLNIIKIK